jgi:hypothetical protein
MSTEAVRLVADFGKYCDVGLRADHCRLGMRVSVGTNANNGGALRVEMEFRVSTYAAGVSSVPVVVQATKSSLA